MHKRAYIRQNQPKPIYTNMKGKSLVLACAFVASVANAQLPAHNKVVERYPDGKGFYQVFTEWDATNPKITDDDNFYISRVRPAQRFADAQSQYNPSATTDRKLLWWCPAGVADTYWSSLPRYTFNADAFSAWSMVDIHGNWADGVGRVPGAFSDAAHRNGVQNGCIFFFDSTGGGAGFGGSDTQKFFSDLAKTDATGDYYNCRKFIRFIKYYGIDGIGINPEAGVGSYANSFKTVLEKLHEIAPQEGWHFRVDWYDAQTNGGAVSWANALTTGNSEWFQRSTSEWPVSDAYFLNYNWYQNQLRTSTTTATNLGRSTYDVYTGFDIQGRGLSSVNGGSAGYGWELLPNYNFSIGIWGAHGKNIIYENSNEYGSDAMSIQTLYQKKQEQFFWSGTRNIVNAPAVTNTVTSLSSSAMKTFHGMSRFLEARSVLSALPFVTYFNIGNGQRLYNEGKVAFDQEWYNLGVQDILPTWRWWIADDAGKVPAKAIEAELTYKDSWKGGSALRFSGETAKSNVRLFKTQFNVSAADRVTVRYKRMGGEGKMSLLWSADGSTMKTSELPASTKGEWTEFAVNASEIGMAGAVKMLGLTFEGTSADYAVEIGEMAIRNAATYAPATPVITRAELCGERYNAVDIKMIWKSKDGGTNAWEPVYNDEVDTWYFEVYAQVEGSEPFLATTCSSWAAYVVNIPMPLDLATRVRYGVCAVAPDGLTRSEIAWTGYEARDESQLEVSDAVTVDKAVIKPNETFTVGFEDPFHAVADFKIVNAASGAVLFEQKGVKSVTTSLADLGTYDVVAGKTTYPGLISISPLSTGALPIIGDLTVDKGEAAVDEEVTATLTIERLGEGKVSRGLVVEDPVMLRFSPEMCASPDFTVAFWIKPTAFAHGKYGTNLFNKRDWSGSWPHNNWGTIWMHIWPDVEVYSGVNPNIISFTQYGNNKNPYSPVGSYPNGNPHESPNMTCAGNDLSLAVGNWYHVAFSVSNSRQCLFLNGKRVAMQTVTWGGLNTQNGCTSPQYCYIGGTNTYHGGFIGVVDDVQYWDVYTSDANEFLIDAMQGFDGREIPEHLKGYWDFEDAPTEGSSYVEEGTSHTAKSLFKNKGRNTALEAETMYLEGASGENPTGYAKTVDGENNVGGNPNLPGSIDITTKTSWILPDDASSMETDNINKVSFATMGEKPITARLENNWGKDERTVNVVITKSVGIDAVESTSELRYDGNAITVLFAEGGDYTVSVSTIDGRLLQSGALSVGAGELTNFRLAGKGNLVVTVRGNGMTKTIKIIR